VEINKQKREKKHLVSLSMLRTGHTALELSCPSSSRDGEVSISTSSMSVASLVRGKLNSIREMKEVQENRENSFLQCPICKIKFLKSVRTKNERMNDR
jgi:hypothetical protein